MSQPAPMPARRLGLLGFGLVILSVASAIGTFLVLVDVEPIASLLRNWVAQARFVLKLDPAPLPAASDTAYSNAIDALFVVNASFIVALLVLLAVEVGSLIAARRRGQAGAALHMRVIGLFSIVSAMPVILLATVAIISLDRGLDNLFSTRVHDIVTNSVKVAQTYVDEQGILMRGEALAMAADLNRIEPIYVTDPGKFQQYLKAMATYRGLPGVMLLTHDGRITDRSDILVAPNFPLPPPPAIASADRQDAVFIEPGSRDVMGIVVKLTAYDNRYLFYIRPFDKQVSGYLRTTEESAARFQDLEATRFPTQVNFALLYAIIALNMLLAAIWIGLSFANRLVDPIRRLIAAADQVGSGNLYVRVPVAPGSGDLGKLGDTFNNMTDTLRTQRNELLGANDLLDSRRRFIEAVLSGVSTGVIGIDEEGRITVVNPLAARWIGSRQSPLGRPLAELMPELAVFLHDAMAVRSRLVQGQITLNREGRERNITVRVTSEQSNMREHGYVVTLDDITELVVAQRSSAWADVARRIAHEIKNPLTPIQLSAERIRRKYGKVIVEDREVFDQCTNTIVRQVDDIKRMVDEFSSFARMPKPSIEREDFGEMVRQVVFMMRIGYPDIAFTFEPPQEPILARFDRRLLSQAVTNIVKNATEAITGLPEALREPGQITVSVVRDGTNVAVQVIDNGIGLPKENRQKLLEPYVTTREKGTGLGLAIVGKIMEEHGGGIELLDAPSVASGGHGAMMRLWLPTDDDSSVAA
ncbi:two-component system nitrogen regulation sensor histidine kinase NtrY [Labrys monachus]|uniref:histidine kinase n=1 Tax=Labrys monachus TaxID=217067 RepID=A0ABU0FET3_9HYPH|nr:two-component system nitrogen regulation sensor histidine kinase NtrY [Labrys monachus]